MSRTRGTATAFGSLRTHVERSRLRCPACGYVDDDGGWRVTTSGGLVRYRHVCPSCGATDEFELDLG